MRIDIMKCENGWMVHENFPNRGETRAWIFKTLQELAEWIIENPMLAAGGKTEKRPHEGTV